ncbi:oxidoreductase [Arcicella sp. DC2W]|uniref:Oxidoreductase n=1 Tax=Arcicella gelida TaxID=2984195 RepID=A0ABU5S3Z9_9BACT|nr:oxidoreductase [Arcicella sp. DC2W]MEA5403193.1 oxidoreductase [Arcicella sp. DC2W]
MENSNNKVWLITGCSTGFGRAFATTALRAGYLVAVASRKTSDIQDIVDAYPNTALAVKLDVTNTNEIKAAVRATLDHFGKIDVLLNNAGIGYFGAIEESDDAETRRMFEINFFGLANLTKEVLPLMRSQKSGHIINVASIGGIASYPALGYYHATKYAVDGFSESLSKEVGHLGIKVTIVAPGAFRTDWAGRSANETPGKISDYAETAEITKVWLRNKDGNQPGNPVKAAEAIIKVVECPNPPLRLLLGHDAMEAARAKLVLLTKDFDEWESTTLNVNF